jgi:hypothetical protein
MDLAMTLALAGALLSAAQLAMLIIERVGRSQSQHRCRWFDADRQHHGSTMHSTVGKTDEDRNSDDQYQAHHDPRGLRRRLGRLMKCTT